MSSEVRRRIPKTSEPVPPSPVARARAEDESNPFSIFEILRTLTLLFIASSALSWFVTKDDIWWGHRPQATRLDFWQDLLKGPVNLTPEELARFDGSDPALPIYLAINGTIYDVTKGARFYGPGGSYHWFAGVDATRGYVTGCFAEDRTPDLRGVERMYMPTSEPEVDAQYSSGRLKTQKEQEKRFALKQVEKGVKHWVDFFANSPKYKAVGKVKLPKDWEKKLGPPKKLCEKAENGRPKREPPPADE